MPRFIASLVVPFAAGLAAHIIGRPYTRRVNTSTRTRDLMRYTIGAVLINILGFVFSPHKGKLEHAASNLITTTSLGMGVVVGFFITGDDNYA